MRAETKFLLVLAFWFLLFAEVLSWVTASWPGDCIINPEQNAAAADQAYQKNCPTFHAGVWIALKRADRVIGRHDKSIVAVFTVVLAISTIGLWTATVRLWKAGDQQLELIASNASRQSRDMEASIAVASRAATAAEKAAEAAGRSADAAVGVKIARVHLRAAALYEPGPPFGKPGSAFKTEITEGFPPKNSQLGFAFHNMGETFARVTGVCLEYIIAPRLPKVPTYERIIQVPSNSIIKPGEDYEFQAWPLFIVTDEEIERFAIPYVHRLWVYGYIHYLDFLNFPHEHCFCRRWDAISVMGSPVGFVSTSDAPREYTQSH
jgi:hypothetical protein